MDNTRTITITKADFMEAIINVVISTIRDPNFMEDRAEATMTFCMGGMVFAREVMDTLFGKESEEGVVVNG